MKFLMTRLRNQFQEKHPTDLVNAVFATKDTNPVALNARLEAMSKLSKTPDFASMRATFKRVMGLSKDHVQTDYSPKLLTEETKFSVNETQASENKEGSNSTYTAKDS